MTRENIKNTAIMSVGYDYQVLQGLLVLCDWLDSPTRFNKVKFECDDEEIVKQGLDDIVVERSDGLFDFYQVKYTPDVGEYFLTWEWLLESSGKTKRSRSNIKKWFDALSAIDSEKVGSVRLLTNRIPDKEIESCLNNTAFLNFDQASNTVQDQLRKAIGEVVTIKHFLSKLEIIHSDRNYKRLEAQLINRICRHADIDAFNRIYHASKKWAQFKGEPQPDWPISLKMTGESQAK